MDDDDKPKVTMTFYQPVAPGEFDSSAALLREITNKVAETLRDAFKQFGDVRFCVIVARSEGDDAKKVLANYAGTMMPSEAVIVANGMTQIDTPPEAKN